MIKNEFHRLRCGHCHKYLLNKDQVLLDEINTMIHLKCYTPEMLPIIDRGLYKELIEKYDFFKEFA